MQIKKNKKANLDDKVSLFRQMGLIVSLSIMFVAFEYNYTDVNAETFEPMEEIVVEEEMVPITRAEMPPPPPPPPPQFNMEVLTIVDDDIDLDEEMELEDLELDEELEVDIIDYQEEEEQDDDFVFQRVEKMPQFPGGYSELAKYLAQHLHFPEVAQENGIQGRVFVKFVVDREGQIGNIEILKGVDRFLDKEAVRVVKNMPLWSPGEQRGRPVNVSCNLPITFALQ